MIHVHHFNLPRFREIVKFARQVGRWAPTEPTVGYVAEKAAAVMLREQLRYLSRYGGGTSRDVLVHLLPGGRDYSFDFSLYRLQPVPRLVAWSARCEKCARRCAFCTCDVQEWQQNWRDSDLITADGATPAEWYALGYGQTGLCCGGRCQGAPVRVLRRFPVPVYRAKYLFNGGLIYHGPGAGETFSVTLTPVDGWSVHT